MTQTLALPLNGQLSMDILKSAIEVSTTSTMLYGASGGPTVNALTVTAKKSLLKKIFKK